MLTRDAALCMESAQKGKAFGLNENCIVPDVVAKKLRRTGLIELNVYGGSRCEEPCSIGEKCWKFPKNVHPDVLDAITFNGRDK
ncbi:MAG: hypothetical protein ACM3UU_09125 [Ignavibacteriales bacterium]